MGTSKDKWFKQAKNYLTTRGITEEQIFKHKIGFSLMGRYAYRVIFPVREEKKLVGFVSRSFINKEPRYLNSSGLKSLYNRASTGKTPIVVGSEGVFKALKIERVVHGLKDSNVNSIAFLGHGLTDRQEDMLDGTKELVLWPDPDSVGIEGMIKIAQKMHDRMLVTFPYPMPTKQADEMEDWEVVNALMQRKPYTNALGMQYQHQMVMQKRLGI